MRPTTVALALIALAAIAGDSGAQSTARQERGLSTAIGLSKGSGALTCSFCTGQGKGGVAGQLGVESAARRGVRFGLEVDWWLHSGGGASRSVLAVAPVALLYPSGGGSLFLKGGVGVGRFAASTDEEELRTTAVTAFGGIGYEIRLSARSAIVPYVSWLNGRGGTLRLNGARVTSQSGLSLFQYGVALSKR